MMKREIFDGIVGVEGTIPFSVIVTVGEKGPSGAPRNTDRFYLLHTGHGEIKGKQGAQKLFHPHHPDFRAFNTADKDRTQTLLGNLVFPTRERSMHYQLAAQQIGQGKRGSQATPPGGGSWETPPNGMPACTGDGERARRFNGMVNGEPEFVEIACPNRECQFRQKGSLKICGALARLYFRLRWADGSPLRSVLARYQTHGWNTTENMLGLFGAVDEAAAGLGMEPGTWSYAGLPFSMTVGIKRKPTKGQRFPVVQFGIEDVMAFLHWQVEQRQFLAGAPKSVALLAQGHPEDEDSQRALGEALDTVTAGNSIPAEEYEVVDAEFVEAAPEPAQNPSKVTTTQEPVSGDQAETETAPPNAADEPESPEAAAKVSDDRTPGERLIELAKSLGYDGVKAGAVAKKVLGGGVKLKECPPMMEDAVAEALRENA